MPGGCGGGRARRREWSRRVLPAVFVVAIGLVSACAPASRPGDTGAIGWEACPDAPAVGDLAGRLQCGLLRVPLDPATGGGTVTLALARLRASGPAQGTVVINPGGPGASGVRYLLGAAPSLSAMRFTLDHDVVSFDPRGVGRSTPTVRCRTDAERDAQRSADLGDRSPAGIAAAERDARRVAGLCRTRVGSEVLTRLGTGFVVEDLERIRIALGENRIDFLGYSYGSRLGIEYARNHPSRIGALVLDGVDDPDADPIAATLAQARAFQDVFAGFAADCARIPECPLGADPAGAVSEYQRLVRPLRQRPVRVADGRLLTYDAAVEATGMALYRRDLWPTLRSGLAGIAPGPDGQNRGAQTLMSLADTMEGRDAAGHYDNSADAFLAVRCADGPQITDRALVDRLDREQRQAAPYADDGRGTGRGALDECAFWPTSDRRPEEAPRREGIADGAPTPVVVATVHDPATPYAAGVAAATRLRARLISVGGYGHTAALQGNVCVDSAVDAYFSRLAIPNGPLTC